MLNSPTSTCGYFRVSPNFSLLECPWPCQELITCHFPCYHLTNWHFMWIYSWKTLPLFSLIDKKIFSIKWLLEDGNYQPTDPQSWCFISVLVFQRQKNLSWCWEECTYDTAGPVYPVTSESFQVWETLAITQWVKVPFKWGEGDKSHLWMDKIFYSADPHTFFLNL